MERLSYLQDPSIQLGYLGKVRMQTILLKLTPEIDFKGQNAYQCVLTVNFDFDATNILPNAHDAR